MSRIYMTSLESGFARALKTLFEERAYEVVTEPCEGIEYFIDVTDEYIPGDNKKVGEGIDAEAAAQAYVKNVCLPIEKLQCVLPWMVGKKRICFANSVKASVNWSQEVAGFGHNMSKAALNQILVLTKNGLIDRGFTFRIFDPMTDTVPADKAAGSAYVYFTRDRFNDGPNNLFRMDERNLVVRDALGREIPW